MPHSKANRKIFEKNLRAKRQILLTELKTKPCHDCSQWHPPGSMIFSRARGEAKFSLCNKTSVSEAALLKASLDFDVVCSSCWRVRLSSKYKSRPLEPADEVNQSVS